MNRLAVRQQDNPQVSIVHLWHLAPPPDAPILLNCLPNWRGSGALDPCVLNQRSIGALKLRGRPNTPDRPGGPTISTWSRRANQTPYHGPLQTHVKNRNLL